MDASVQRCRLLALGPICIMQCSSEQVQRTLASVMVANKYFLSLHNVLSHLIFFNSYNLIEIIASAAGRPREGSRTPGTLPWLCHWSQMTFWAYPGDSLSICINFI